MALLECPECKSSISSMAKSCPSCGVPLKNDLQEPLKPVIKDVALGVRLFKYLIYVVVGGMLLEGAINLVMTLSR